MSLFKRLKSGFNTFVTFSERTSIKENFRDFIQVMQFDVFSSNKEIENRSVNNEAWEIGKDTGEMYIEETDSFGSSDRIGINDHSKLNDKLECIDSLTGLEDGI